MVWLCFIWFSILYGGTFYFSRAHDFFSPLKFVSLKLIIINLPFILYSAFFHDSVLERVLTVCNVTIDEAFWQYTKVQTVAYISLIAGVLLYNKIFKGKSYLQYRQQAPVYTYKSIKIAAYIFIAAGLAGYFIFLFNIGGLSVLLSNLANRVALQGGQYILILLPFLSLGGVCLLLNIKQKNRFWDKVAFVAFSVLIIAVFTSFGSRKSSVIYIIILIVAAYYFYGAKLKNKNMFIMGGLVSVSIVIYMLLIPLLRGDKSDIKSAVTFRQLVYHTSYTFIDVFAANYFNENNIWQMKGYFTPVKVLGTSQSRDSLPQLDQGVYFNTIVYQKRYVAPPVPRSELSRASWPTENFGFAYANFLMPGIIFFFFLLGMVYTFVYRILCKDVFNPILVTLYTIVIFSFDFSSLRIANMLRLLPVLFTAYILLKLLNNRKIIVS
ncbi:hypothetical protein [Flavobacterium rhizosphaerae]|uniref:Oligosaccharide repeat unit polymerase n=1 Tax=Flavobacterium rhizosphaerae TaxID=3163298 RepID=A0ABW8YXH9_9FLAO